MELFGWPIFSLLILVSLQGSMEGDGPQGYYGQKDCDDNSLAHCFSCPPRTYTELSRYYLDRCLHGVKKEDVKRYFRFIRDKVTSDWKDLAWCLGFETPDIENIYYKHRDDKSRCMELLHQWYKEKGNAATIHVLMRALSDAKLQHVVDSLKDEYPGTGCSLPGAGSSLPTAGSSLPGTGSSPLDTGSSGAEGEQERPQPGEETGRYMNDPIKLTSMGVVDGRRQVFISPEAEKIISNLQSRSVDVVAVVGPMRKGKSHLANLLCKRKSGFELGDEFESKTKDFWFWIGSHPVQTNRYLMVVDTEGLGDYSDEEQTAKDIKYLVLATLFSNHLVFNLQGNPDVSFISQLRLMGDLAEHVRVQKNGSDEGNNLGDHFPELWVAVQQAHLKPPHRDGRRLTPDEFLEVMLERKDGHTKAIRSHNEMTAAVKAFFPKRHLRLIPAPSIDKNILSNLDKVGDNLLQADYKETVDSFTREIWNSGQVKRVNGDDIKSTGLLHIMKYYVNALNDPNAMPSVLGAHEAMAEGECRRALDEHMKQFQETIENTVKPLMPTDEETCNSTIKAAAQSAVSKLSAEIGKWDKDGTWKGRLEGKLKTEHLALLKLNSAKSKDLCEAIINEVDQPVQQKVGEGVYNRIGGFDTYVREMDTVYSAYRQKASGKGPAVEEVLKTFEATETTRRNTIKDTDDKLVEEDRRVKAAEAEAARQAAEAQRQAEIARAAQSSSRRRRRRRGWF